MYKILLADDEGIAIESLTYIIEKDFPGKCDLRSAKTGRSVIELAETWHPDIAVMDIQMPGINGIEAMKKIKDLCPTTLFIVVTAYDKFDYAKESISLGVISYQTKPLDRKKFTDALQTALTQIDKIKERRSNDLKVLEKLETVIPVIESGMIYSILFQDNFETDIANYKNLLDIPQTHGYMMVIECGEAPEMPEHSGKASLENTIGTGFRIQNYYQNIRIREKSFHKKAVIGPIMSNKIIVFVPYDETMLSYNDRIHIIDQARDLIGQLEAGTDVIFRIGIGSVKPLNDMKASYREALNSLKEGNNNVSHADDLPVACSYEQDYPIELEKLIFDSIAKGDINNTLEASDHFFRWMEESHGNDLQGIRIKSIEFILWAEHIAYENGAMGLYHFDSRDDYLDIISGITDLHIMRKWFIQKISDACSSVESKSKKQTSCLLDTATKWISEHYRNDVSLDDVSREVNVSPYYFSRLFKEGCGITFIEYLTNLRMEKAKELLQDQTCTVREVCSSVGYQDPNYFSRIFKKSVGVTPTEYKESLSKPVL